MILLIAHICIVNPDYNYRQRLSCIHETIGCKKFNEVYGAWVIKEFQCNSELVKRDMENICPEEE